MLKHEIASEKHYFHTFACAQLRWVLTRSGGSGLFLFGSLEDERTKSRRLTVAVPVPGVRSQGQSLGEGVPLAEMAALLFSLGRRSLRPQGTTHWQALCYLGCFLAKHRVAVSLQCPFPPRTADAGVPTTADGHTRTRTVLPTMAEAAT